MPRILIERFYCIYLVDVRQQAPGSVSYLNSRRFAEWGVAKAHLVLYRIFSCVPIPFVYPDYILL